MKSIKPKQYTDLQFAHFDELAMAVYNEHHHQIKKWGKQTHSMFEWYTYTGEELGEVAEAIAENEYRDGSAEEIYKEAIQVATLALKIAEMAKYGNKKK